MHTWRGRRLKLRYRGVTKNHAWLKRRTALLNLRNLTGRGLTGRHGQTRAAAQPAGQAGRRADTTTARSRKPTGPAGAQDHHKPAPTTPYRPSPGPAQSSGLPKGLAGGLEPGDAWAL